jgi:hypothetical protein
MGTQVSVLMARQPGRLCTAGKVGVVPRGPQAGALLGRGGPFKRLTLKFSGDLLHRLGLLFHTGG